jgi:hypothetical protein
MIYKVITREQTLSTFECELEVEISDEKLNEFESEEICICEMSLLKNHRNGYLQIEVNTLFDSKYSKTVLSCALNLNFAEVKKSKSFI